MFLRPVRISAYIQLFARENSNVCCRRNSSRILKPVVFQQWVKSVDRSTGSSTVGPPPAPDIPTIVGTVDGCNRTAARLPGLQTWGGPSAEGARVALYRAASTGRAAEPRLAGSRGSQPIRVAIAPPDHNGHADDRHDRRKRSTMLGRSRMNPAGDRRRGGRP